MHAFKSTLLAVVLVAAGATPAFAADTTTFNVKIIILKACTITAAAATDVDFTSVASTSTANVDAQGSVTANCTALTPYNIALNAGVNAGTANDITTRRMKNINAAVLTNNFVAYQLYRDAGRALVWGNTIGTNTLAGTGTGLNQPYPVYGRVANPSTNNAADGSYLDTVTATITY
jgi:spore coat protein U domain-containing protein, fimbrial subunit CupE1/2/3/6